MLRVSRLKWALPLFAVLVSETDHYISQALLEGQTLSKLKKKKKNSSDPKQKESVS